MLSLYTITKSSNRIKALKECKVGSIRFDMPELQGWWMNYFSSNIQVPDIYIV